MKTRKLLPPLPEARVDNLAALDAGLPVLALLCLGGGADNASLLAQLSPLYQRSADLNAAIDRLVAEKHLTRTGAGALRMTDAGAAAAEDRLGALGGRAWTSVSSRLLPGVALGLDMRAPKSRAYLARKENLESAALARLFSLKGVGPMPSRAGLRFALLRAFLLARMPECEPALTEITMQNTSRDAISRAILLGAAGLKRGTLRDAETALLRNALHLGEETRADIASGLVRAALANGREDMPAAGHRLGEQANGLLPSAGDDLAGFASDVRELAKTLQTAPFTGRVAIAQVYDSGVMRGLEFGSLDDFKERIAAAGRAGLLDLERYDIAGPMDSVLRDRSRTAFGRDERHFIVNEWI